MTRQIMVLAASVLLITAAQAADKTKEGPPALERKLHGEWKGPACGGNWTFGADGTFAVEHYSPGNNKATGAWELRWNALPPTLALTLKTSDAPERIKVGETWEVQIIQLDDEALAYVWPKSPEKPIHWTRVKK
jgi:hypothetical protein